MVSTEPGPRVALASVLAVIALTACTGGGDERTAERAEASAQASREAGMGPRNVLERFMEARIERRDDVARGLMAPWLRASIDRGLVKAPTVQVSNPCWYRYEVASFTRWSRTTAGARVRVYEHWWPGDVAGGPPRSWEQQVGLVEMPAGWEVDELGPRRNEREEPGEPHGRNRSACRETARRAPQPTLLYLAGDGELTVVDVAARSSRTLKLPQLSPGDPPYRILRAGDKLVLYGRNAVYTVDLQLRSEPRKLAEAWFFIPAAEPDRLSLAILDPKSPETVRALTSVREVAVDGRVTVPGVPPPGGRWPVAAVDDALVLEGRAGGLEVWDRTTRKVTRVLPGEAAGAGHGNRLPWCSHDYGKLHVTDVRTGDELAVAALAGFATFDCWSAAFSPDGSLLAVPVAERRDYEAHRALALIDLERGVAKVVQGSWVESGYVFVAWASSGESVFISGGKRLERRTLVQYQVGAERAVALPVRVGDFYGMAAS